MSDEKKTETTAEGDAASERKSSGKLIAGKFKTVEDAVEQGYIGLENAFHETREELSAVKQLLEKALTPIGERGTSGDDSYRRGHTTDEDDDVNPTDFLASPGKILKAREKELEDRVIKKAAAITADMIARANLVAEFKLANPDLVEHEPLVSTFMRDTDERDPLNKRLKDAANKTRKYLASLKTKDGNNESSRKPENEEYLETPGGTSEEDMSSGKEKAEADESLAEYIKARKASHHSHFVSPKK